MAVDLINSSVWRKQTSRFGKLRSKELMAVDEALRSYEASPSDIKLKSVKQAFDAWKAKAGDEWEESKRNRGGVVSDLEDRLLGRRNKFAADLNNSREGLLYLFAKTKVKGGWATLATEGITSLGNGFIGLEKVQQGIGIGTPNQLLGAAIGGEIAARNSGTAARVVKGREIFEEIKEYFRTLGPRIADGIVGTWQSATGSTMGFLSALDGLSGYVESAVNIVLSHVLEKVAPFVGSGMTMARGLKDAVTETVRRINVYRSQKGLQFNTGHPTVIFRQIETAMEISAAKGLYQAIKGAGLITADVFSFGASAVVSLICTGVELLVKLISRGIEMFRMRKFFLECEPKWEAVKAVRGRTDPKTGRPATTEFVADGPAFAEWFKSASFAMPCLSMLALKSGIVGDKLRMIRLYAGEAADPVLDDRQGKFDKGVKYIDRLKAWGENYLEDTGFKFYSTDAVVEGLLNRRTLMYEESGVALP